MLKEVTFKDEQNGVSAIITDHGEGTPPEVLIKDNVSNCTLDVPKDSDLYRQLVGLSQTLTSAGVSAGEQGTLAYTVVEQQIGKSSGFGLSASTVMTTTTRGKVTGNFGAFAAELKKQCANFR